MALLKIKEIVRWSTNISDRYTHWVSHQIIWVRDQTFWIQNHIWEKIDGKYKQTPANQTDMSLIWYENDFAHMKNPYIWKSQQELFAEMQAIEWNLFIGWSEKRKHKALVRLAYTELMKEQSK